MRALIIHNPRSGFGSDAVFEFERSLLREGDECTVRILSRDFRTREAVADAASYDVVVLSGGDSTVTSLMHALIGTDVPVCVFPSGTENLLSATIGNAPEPAALARACRVGKTALLDLTRTSWLATDGTRHTSGVGLLAGVGYDMQLLHSSLTAPGTFGNAFFFATTLQSTHPTVASIQVTVDGQEHSYRGISCLVAHDTLLPGDVQAVPGNRLDDALLDVIVLEAPGEDTKSPNRRGLIDDEGNPVGRPILRTLRGRHVDVQVSKDMPFCIDGNQTADLVRSFSAEELPRACRVIVDTMSPYCPKDDAAPRFSGTDEIAYPEG